MFESDYILRLFHDMVRFLMRLLTNKDCDIEDIDFSEIAGNDTYSWLFNMVKEGRINEAENELYDILDVNDTKTLQLALGFYDYLNDLDENTLDQSDYTREEIKDGLFHVMKMFGYSNVYDTFLL